MRKLISHKSLITKNLFALTSSFLLFSTTHAATSSQVPRSMAVPGGVTRLAINSDSKTAPQAYYQKHRVMVVKNNNDKTGKKAWLAVVGIPLASVPGTQYLKVDIDNNKLTTQTFKIKRKAYATQYLTITNKRKVTPNKLDMRRIKKEKAEINKILSHWSVPSQPLTQFNLPIQGHKSSSFGLRRYYNKKPRSPHTGMDLAAPLGTPVKAPAAGTVIGTGNFFFTGNTVFLDHGYGVISIYAHLNKIKVKKGETLKRGEVLGTVGKTGRATGPHLHWGISMNDARVNPALFIAKRKSKSKKN